MRLAVSFAGTNDVHGQIQAVVEAEQDGFDGAWSEQVFGPDVLTVIAMAGEKTSRIELGTSVVPTYPRHPLVMAQQALTAQAATGGRFSLGIGLSHKPVVEGMWGMSYEKPAVHMREYLSVLRPLLKEGRVSFNGEFFRVNATVQVVAPEPPPVLIAALAPVMLRLAGEMADGTVTWMVGRKTLETHIVPRINSAAKAAGRAEPRVVVALPIAVTDDVDEARKRAARSFQVYGALPNYQRMLNIEGAAGPAELAIIGDEKQVEDQLRGIAAAGATDFLANVFPVGDNASGSLDRTRALLKTLIGKL
jgi:F420-dependent oxidoreductase-like protein